MTVKQIHAAQALLRIINILELSILSQSKCKAFKGEPYYATVDCEPFSQRSFPLEGEHIAALLYRSSPIRPLASSRAALFFSPSCQRKSPQIDSQKTTPLATLVSDRLLKTLGLQPTRSSLGRLWD